MIAALQIFAETADHAEEEAAGIAALGIDPLAILAQAVTFLVLFWVVKKFALDKIVNTLEERRKTIDSGVSLGLEMQAEKEKLDQAVEQKLQEARLEADKILAGAQQEAGSIVKQAEESATQKVKSMISDAHARMEDDVQKAKRELKKEMVDLVAEATEIVINEKLDAHKDDELVRRALAGIEK